MYPEAAEALAMKLLDFANVSSSGSVLGASISTTVADTQISLMAVGSRYPSISRPLLRLKRYTV